MNTRSGLLGRARSLVVSGLGIFTVLSLCSTISARSGNLDFEFSLRSAYDDNILSYSDADLDLMDDPAAPENKYGIISRDDYIFVPTIGLTYKTHMAKHTTYFGLAAAYNYYMDNDIKRHGRLGAMARRYFRRGMYLQADLTLIPDYYYRNSYSTTAGYQEAKFDKISGRAKFSFQPFKKVIANISYEYSNKNFESLFDERDIKAHRFKVEGIYKPGKRWKGWGSYAFETAGAAGADNPTFLRDTSYDSFIFTYGSRFYLRGLGRKALQLAGVVSYSITYFQSGKLTDEDRYRFGRKDDLWQISLTIEQQINKHLDFGLGFKRRSKAVDLPAVDLAPFLEYTSNLAYFNLIFAY